MRKELMDLLACPICKHHPLDLHIFEEKEEIEEAIIICSNCNRWYPVIETIPHMLPDDLRAAKEDLPWLKKWKDQVPEATLQKGKPFTLSPKD